MRQQSPLGASGEDLCHPHAFICASQTEEQSWASLVSSIFSCASVLPRGSLRLGAGALGEAVTGWEGWLGSLGSEHPVGLFQEKLEKTPQNQGEGPAGLLQSLLALFFMMLFISCRSLFVLFL